MDQINGVYFTIIQLTSDTKKLMNERMKNEACTQLVKKVMYKYSRVQDQINSYVGYLLLKKILKKIYDIKLTDEDIEYMKYGKPYLKNYLNIHFNISHSEEMVVCAVSNDVIGVDVERERDIEVDDILQLFHYQERIAIQHIKEEKGKQKAFFKLWTAKESYLKYLGIGLVKELTDFIIQAKDQTQDLQVVEDKESSLYYYTIGETYHMHICTKGEKVNNNIIFISF